MTEQIQLDIPLVLPDIPDANDACVARLTSNLAARPGIEKAHIVPAEGDKPALLCIHYDPGILSLSRIRDIARGAGAARRGQARSASRPGSSHRLTQWLRAERRKFSGHGL